MNIHSLNPDDYDVDVSLPVEDVFVASSEQDIDRDKSGNVLRVKQLHVGTFLKRIQHGLRLMRDEANSDIQRIKYRLPALVVDAASGTCDCGDYTIDVDDASFYIFSATDCEVSNPSIWCVVPGLDHVLDDMEFTIKLADVVAIADRKLKKQKSNQCSKKKRGEQ